METIEVKRTQGVWECGYGDNSKAFGIFTKKIALAAASKAIYKTEEQ